MHKKSVPDHVCVPPICCIFFYVAGLVAYFGTLITPLLKIHRKSRSCFLGISYISRYRSSQPVAYLIVNNRYVFNWVTERRQLSDRFVGDLLSPFMFVGFLSVSCFSMANRALSALRSLVGELLYFASQRYLSILLFTSPSFCRQNRKTSNGFVF